MPSGALVAVQLWVVFEQIPTVQPFVIAAQSASSAHATHSPAPTHFIAPGHAVASKPWPVSLQVITLFCSQLFRPGSQMLQSPPVASHVFVPQVFMLAASKPVPLALHWVSEFS
jgi:hypothetical protein